MKEQIIAHLDMDSFYASVEIRDNPSLTGKPVVIGSDPQEGRGRGVISTCSYEARRFGLHSGMPISKAWHLCPQAVYIRPSGKYSAVSEAIMEILQEFADEIEQVSIDEAYLNLSYTGSWDEAQILGKTIKEAINDRESLTCSIGIAPSRTYAKIASDLDKPDGLVVLLPDRLKQTLAPLPVSVIPGIGKKSASALESLGIHTISVLAHQDIQRLQDIFGGYAVRILEIASGRDGQGLKVQGPRRSIGRETTFPEDTTDRSRIYFTFRSLASSLQQELMKKKIMYRTVGIRIRYTGFITLSRGISFPHPDDRCDTIVQTAITLFEELWNGEPVRLVGIRLSGLLYQDPIQRTLAHFMPI
jgi:DNA polymerase IV (DinB-like DNA polymerase)